MSEWEALSWAMLGGLIGTVIGILIGLTIGRSHRSQAESQQSAEVPTQRQDIEPQPRNVEFQPEPGQGYKSRPVGSWTPAPRTDTSDGGGPVWNPREWEHSEPVTASREITGSSQAPAFVESPAPPPMLEQSHPTPEPQPEVAPPFSPELVREIYRRWCEERGAPVIPATVRATPLRFAGTKRVNDWTPPTHAYEDHSQIGEFVRFSDAQDGQSCALPHPEAAFSSLVHPLMFSGLSVEVFNDSTRLAALSPVPLRRCDDTTWEVAT
jgi:hypothetical protein